MTDVLSGAIGIYLGQQRVRQLRQRGPQRLRESPLEAVEIAIAQDAAYLQQFIHHGGPRILAKHERILLRRVLLHEPMAGCRAAPRGYSAMAEIEVRAAADPKAWNEKLE